MKHCATCDGSGVVFEKSPGILKILQCPTCEFQISLNDNTEPLDYNGWNQGSIAHAQAIRSLLPEVLK